jgi:hypothetical protein
MENIAQADALLFGRVTYEMMEAAWRLATRTVAMPDWTEPFARTIDARSFVELSWGPLSDGTCSECTLVRNRHPSRGIWVNVRSYNRESGANGVQSYLIVGKGYANVGTKGGGWSHDIVKAWFSD